MASSIRSSSREHIFRRYLSWFVAEVSITFAAITCFAILSIATGQPFWLVADAVGIVILTLQVRTYAVCAVIVRGGTLSIRRGCLRVVEYPLLLWRDSPIYRTTLLGAIFGYSSVIIRADDGYIGMDQVANIQELTDMVDRIQADLFRR